MVLSQDEDCAVVLSVAFGRFTCTVIVRLRPALLDFLRTLQPLSPAAKATRLLDPLVHAQPPKAPAPGKKPSDKWNRLQNIRSGAAAIIGTGAGNDFSTVFSLFTPFGVTNDMNEWDATAVFNVLDQLLWLRTEPNWSAFYKVAASYPFDAATVTAHWSQLKAGDVLPTQYRSLRNTISHDQFMKVPLDLFNGGLRCIAHGYQHLTPADLDREAAALEMLTITASVLPSQEVRAELARLLRAIDVENHCRLDGSAERCSRWNPAHCHLSGPAAR
jgi:hypothetical protein